METRESPGSAPWLLPPGPPRTLAEDAAAMRPGWVRGQIETHNSREAMRPRQHEATRAEVRDGRKG